MGVWNVTNRLSDEQIKVLAPRLAEMELGEKPLNRTQMAEALGISLHKLGTLRSSAHFQDLFERLKVTREKSVQKAVRRSTLQIREQLADYSNEAVETIYKIMVDTEAKNADRIDAACEILDRDGRFAKVSRLMNVQQGQDGAPMLPEDAAAEILDALKAHKGMVQ